jgi:hypothetical protein
MDPFFVSAAVAAVIACASAPARPPATPATEQGKADPAAQWPESWGVEFGLRCTAAGEDARVCTCIANEVQKKWTPEQFRSLGPEGLREEVRVCRERIGGTGAKSSPRSL